MIKRLPIISWEPTNLRLQFSTFSHDKAQATEEAVKRWLKTDRSRFGCSCALRSFESEIDPMGKALLLKVEWVCDRCLLGLEKILSRIDPGICIELGSMPSREETAREEFIAVPRKSVEFEDGSITIVEPFEVARNPVTTGMFEDFCLRDKYVTAAERARSRETFRSHCGLSGMSKTLRKDVPVCYISYHDAVAFCRWSGFCMPTEAQWLGAALNCTEELDIDTAKELELRTSELPIDRIISVGYDITATRTSSGLVVARRGPLHFKKIGWRDARQLNFHRRFLRPEEGDITVTFRVVHPAYSEA